MACEPSEFRAFYPFTMLRMVPLPAASRQGGKRSVQPERGLVGLQKRVGLLAVVGLHLAEADDGADRLGVVAARLGLAVDVLDVVRDRLLLLLEPLDPLDQKPQFVGRNGAFRHLILLP